MKVLVLGKGSSGLAAAKVLAAQGNTVEFAEGYDCVIASPGVPVKSELQLGCEELLRQGVKLLAVTGSKGKSSVVKLVADALTRAGHRAVPCGNYGLPVSAVSDVEWAVVEVSSFQLETTNLPPDAFEAAAILNLQSDHLARHGSLAVYHALKRRLATFSKVLVAPAEDASSLLANSYFDKSVLRLNALQAVSLMRVAGLSDAQIADAFAHFEPLPHRFQTVAVVSGVTCIDDSKATSLAALSAALDICTGNVRLIAGGLPKGDDPFSISLHLTNHVKKVYLIGSCAEKFRAAWSTRVDCVLCGTLEKAVETALRDAVPGETLLLSPGAASFDQFTSFEARGEAFAQLVQKER